MSMLLPVLPDLVKAKKKAEENLGCRIPDDVALDELGHCMRKMQCIGKDDDYLPILYCSELVMRMQEIAISYF